MSEMRLIGTLSLPQKEADAISMYNKALRELYTVLQEIQQSFHVISHAPPPKLFDGLIRYADGSDWDPGSGKGLYQYQGSAWVKL